MKPATLTAAAQADQAETLTMRVVPTLTADQDARTITGLILPFNVTAERTSAGPVMFTPGSLQWHPDLSRVKLLLDHDPKRPAGHLVTITPDESGVVATFSVAESADGDLALASATDKTRDGLSVGCQLLMSHLSHDQKTLVATRALLQEVSQVSLPAFADSRVLTVKCSMTPADPAPVVPDPAPVVQAAQAPAAAALPPAPYGPPAGGRPALQLNLASLTTQVAASLNAHAGDLNASMVYAALADIVPANDAGKGYLPDELLGELWTARQTSRLFVDLFNDGRPLRSAKLRGWRWKTRPTVGTYAGGKVAIPTSPAETEAAEAAAYRTAGGWDVDRIFIDLGDPDFLESLFQAATEDYLAKSEATMLGLVRTTATAIPGVLTAAGSLLALAGQASTLGASLDAVAMGQDAWEELLSTPQANLPWWLSNSTVDITAGVMTAGKLKIANNADLAAKEILAADRRAIKHREQRLRVNAIDLPKGGIDLGLFAYEAAVVQEPRALWSVTLPA